MAQRHLWIWFLCLQTWSEAAGKDADPMVMNGILGESVTFLLNIQEPKKIDNIAWTSQSSVAFIKPGVNKAEVTITQGTYKGRIEIIDQKYDLVIRDLRMEDAGTYKADINEENEETITKIYYLHIYRRLKTPKITQSLISSLNNTCNITLTCSVEKEEKDVTYSWSPFGEKSNVLQIVHSPMDQKLTYTCTAQNPVSNSSDSITVQQPCTVRLALGVSSPRQPPGGKTKAFSMKDTPSFHPHHAVLPGGLAVLFLLILIPMLAFLFHLYKRRRDRIVLEADDVSKKTVYAVVSRNAQPTESRIYDEIPQSKMLSCKEDPVTTIYSSVQLSEKMRETNMKDRSLPKALGNEIVL